MASHDPSASNPFKDMDSTSSPDSSFRRGPGHDHHHNIPNNPLSGSSSSSSSPTPPPRNLVLCLDGTSNEFSSRNTNVVKLFHITACSSSFTSPQMIYFDSGVGTYLKPSQSSWSSLKKKIAIASELAFAWYVGIVLFFFILAFSFFFSFGVNGERWRGWQYMLDDIQSEGKEKKKKKKGRKHHKHCPPLFYYSLLLSFWTVIHYVLPSSLPNFVSLFSCI